MTYREMTAIQRRLTLMGFGPGPIDGIRGRLTIRAVKCFQRCRGLIEDGIVGPKTYVALFEDAGTKEPIQVPQPNKGLDYAVWYDEALRLRGTKEIVGEGSNPEILNWAENLDIHYPDDDIPWSGLFVAHCIGSTLPNEIIPENPLGARNWNRFGEEVRPQKGAVLVFWRGKSQGWKGHVGFYHGHDQTNFYVLGGNQSNMVNIAKIARNRLLSARWPLTALPPEDYRAWMEIPGNVSTDEQ